MPSAQVVVTTAAPIVVLDGLRNSGVGYPQTAIVKNLANAPSIVYLGDSNVAVGTGFPLAPGESVSLDVIGSQIWGLAATATTTIYVLSRY